jgi:hypothetical protein
VSSELAAGGGIAPVSHVDVDTAMRLTPHPLLAGAVVLALAGCAGSYGPQGLKTGASIAEVTGALGQPTGRYPTPAGERVEYARGPYGKHTYMLDFDTQGRLVRWDQVLTEPRFDTVQAGATRDQVLFAIGHPSESKPLPVQGRTLWSYRYDATFCKWFQVGLDAQGMVVDTGYGPDPMCDDYQNIGVQ